MKYLAGLDLGQAQDYSALAICDYDERLGRGETVYAFRYLHRWPLGTSYPAIVADIPQILVHLPPRSVALAVDATGVGRGVYDLFASANLVTAAIQLHGGHQVTYDRGYWNVPKRDIVAAVQVALQTGRLKIAKALELAATLKQELLDFRYKLDPATAHDSYAAWREKDHDDLVLAVALAVWWGERQAQDRLPALDMSRGLSGLRRPRRMPAAVPDLGRWQDAMWLEDDR